MGVNIAGINRPVLFALRQILYILIFSLFLLPYWFPQLTH
ncbi:hypothetical protein BRDCF_p1970 [Bacteroidales bacterium CF]|nr:hypothetical protein BRDCF_p1970 [Bacteroidales bacterium CF]